MHEETQQTLISIHDFLLQLRYLGVPQHHLSFQGGYLLVHFVHLEADLCLIPVLGQPGQLFDWWTI